MSSEIGEATPETGWRTMIAAWWDALVCTLLNVRRRLFRGRLPEYVVFTLDGDLEERDRHAPFWAQFLPLRKPPMSLEYLGQALKRAAGDPEIDGALFLFKSPQLTLAQAQSLSDLFARFRDWSLQYGTPAKRVVVHIESCGTPGYVAACGADRIFMTPQGEWPVNGLRSEQVYLKETFARVGVEFDVIKIAPWKTAGDAFSRATMSQESKEQINWLLDGLFQDVISAICKGRKLSSEQVRALVDRAPLRGESVLAADLIDGLAYEDELPQLLSAKDEETRLENYSRVAGLLLRHPVRRAGGAVGVISLQGTIVTGPSRSAPVPLPLLGSQQIGSSTAQQMIRAARENDHLRAVVLHVDSPGGSALASDVMWRELTLLSQEKPLVVYMGSVAASGGYYIAAPGRKIVAQSATMTGSIGVIVLKAINQETLRKIDARQYAFERGMNAGLYSSSTRWSAKQKRHVKHDVEQTYRTFKEVVATGREMAYEETESVAQGKVWTGAQAVEHGLVDQVGDIHTAIQEACRLANLPTDGSVRTVNVYAPKKKLLARPLHEIEQALGLDTVQQLRSFVHNIARDDWNAILGSEHRWLIADGLPRVW